MSFVDIQELYNAAMDVLEFDTADERMIRLKEICRKTYKDFSKMDFLIDAKEMEGGESPWKDEDGEEQ